jgi:hypothetical protein
VLRDRRLVRGWPPNNVDDFKLEHTSSLISLFIYCQPSPELVSGDVLIALAAGPQPHDSGRICLHSACLDRD